MNIYAIILYLKYKVIQKFEKTINLNNNHIQQWILNSTRAA